MKYVETKSIDESIQFANENATIVVQKRGVTTI
jgi:bifunctional ADP-heptose synthase (sugar kinase/adenylyltransferase)